MCLIALSVEVFIILYVYEFVKHITVILFVDTFVLIGGLLLVCMPINTEKIIKILHFVRILTTIAFRSDDDKLPVRKILQEQKSILEKMQESKEEQVSNKHINPKKDLSL